MFRIISNICGRLIRFIALSRYNPWTIAEYFRKQGAQVGDDCRFLIHDLGTEPYLIKIGNHVTIAGGVLFVTHDGAVWVFREEVPDIQVFGPIVIEDNCVIGQNAILFPNIRIGRNSIIGAGSVVISDIPPNCIAFGVPARVWSSIEKYKEKSLARWREQKPPDCVIEEGRNWWNSRHYRENRKKLKRRLVSLIRQQNETKKAN